MKSLINKVFNRIGYRITKIYPPDLPSDFITAYNLVKPYTMVSIERCFALWQAVKYINSAGILGDIVECGVWKGGSAMLAIQAQLSSPWTPLNTNRKMWLYDTFDGMPPAGPEDVDFLGRIVSDSPGWLSVSEDEVKKNLKYFCGDMTRFVKGRVENTIPGEMPNEIALLRLDTDFYESTRHELTHLYPLLSPGGVLIIDDYGYWRGAKKAVDEYFGESVLLNRIDQAGRLVIKSNRKI